MIPGHLLASTQGFWRAARALSEDARVSDGAAFFLACVAEQAPTYRLQAAAARHLSIVAARKGRAA